MVRLVVRRSALDHTWDAVLADFPVDPHPVANPTTVSVIAAARSTSYVCHAVRLP
jgi:hypothetical protein